VIEGTGATTVGTRTRWTRWTGYVAFAWGTLFAAQHLCWFLAGRFGQGPTVQDTWSATLSGIFSVLLFGLLALFPLALVWPFCWIGQRRLQIALLAASYVTMILLNLSSFLFSWSGPRSGFGLYPLLVCVIGGLVAFVRPRDQSIAYWMVLVATWAFGAGMALYGGAYVFLAFLQPTVDGLLGYLLVGGVNWTVEGVLFVATAWVVGRNHQFAQIINRRTEIAAGKAPKKGTNDLARGAGGTTGVVSGGRTPPGTWAGYAAFAWTVVFVALHVYWFAGGRIGFGDAPDPIPDPPSSVAGLAFNVAVLAMFVAGLVVPLALVRPWGQRFPRRMLLVLAWLGSGVLAARGGAGIVDSLLLVAGVLPRGLTGLTYEQILGQAHPSAYTLWSGAAIDAYFLIGGVLFGAVAWCYGRKQFRTPKNAG